MKRHLLMFGLSILIAGILFVGCEKNVTTILDEEAELEELVLDEENDYLFDWGIDDGSEDNLFSLNFRMSYPDGFNKPLTPIENVVRFGRIIKQRYPRTIIYRRTARDSALLFLERVLEGRFVIMSRIGSDSSNADSMVVYRKPLRHIVRRKAVFVPRTENPQGRRGWKLKAISLGQGNSPRSTIRIQKLVVINTAGDSLVFTDPLKTMMQIPEDIPRFSRGEEVTVQVYLTNNTSHPVYHPDTGATETVILHYSRSRKKRGRKLFTFMGTNEDGVNIYQGTWKVQEAPRVYHVIVDVIDNGTIFDSDPEMYPYNSVTWSCPYIVER
ncbi:MAG: hypothetical protein GXO78_09955 [Calditrichaeota bacterium]|nr:hypothetical protein [Calditrichota bacterium]